MQGIILGSGIVGLIAKEILGSQWSVVPFSRSRFYSFRPALADNFIVRDERIDDVIAHLGGNVGFIYKTLYSLGGSLLPADDIVANTWLTKVFGAEVPPQACACVKARDSSFIYDIKINRLYQKLQQKHQQDLVANSSKGPVSKIGDHFLVRGAQKIGFDHLVSTIPLSTLFELAGLPHKLKSMQVWYYHIETKDLNFEGANQVLVVDDTLDFFKVANIAENRYLFYFLRDISIPGPYFMQFMQQFDLIDGTTIPNAIPKGPRPDLTGIEKLGIECIGMHAEHDYFMDLGSCLIKLLRRQATFTT